MSEAFQPRQIEIRPQNDDQADFSMATMRLLGIGLRPYNAEILEGVKARLVNMHGEEIGGKVFEELKYRAILGINIASIREKLPELPDGFFGELETKSMKF